MMCFVLGYPVEVHGDCELVADDGPRLFDGAPLSVDVCITEDSPSEPQTFSPDEGGFSIDAGPAGRVRFCLHERRVSVRASRDHFAEIWRAAVRTALDWTFFTPLHAACVARDGLSVILCGDSRAGKSTLAYACARAGWTYVSDNALHWAPAHGVMVSGSPCLRLRPGTRALLGDPEGAEWVDPAAAGFRTARTAAPGPIVFLRRRGGAAELSSIDAAAAVEYFMNYATRPDREPTALRYRELVAAGAWQLEYEHPDDAVRVLERLA